MMRTHNLEQENDPQLLGKYLPHWAVIEDTGHDLYDEDPLARIIVGETTERIAAAIESLPAKERVILALYYFEELTEEEIGRALDSTEPQVSRIRTSALMQLRTFLVSLGAGL